MKQKIVMRNRYDMASQLSNFLRKISKKYKIVNNEDGINVKIDFEKHFCDRVIDRGVDPELVSKAITYLVRSYICQVIYLVEVGEGKRINLYLEGHMFGCSAVKTPAGNYKIKIATVFESSNEDKDRVISRVTLELK